ncbi:MAG: hypothetical protein ACYCWE_20945 [Eubacteriales bacterium]
MARTPFNPKIGTIRSDAGNFPVDRGFIAHYNIPAAKVTAESDTAVLALTTLTDEVQEITAGINPITTPRNVKVDASAAITTDVTIHGTNFAGEEIEETLTLNGTTAVAGTLAFASVTSVELPIATTTPAKQKATVAVTQGAQAAGSTVFTFVSAATGAAFDITVAFLIGDDTTAEACTKLCAGLNANAAFAAKFTATPSTANVLIESKLYLAQDATINLTVKTAGTSAITVGAITVDTVAGVAEDKVSVGVGKIFGIPYLLTADELVFVKLFNNSADTGTVVADDDEIEKNTIALNGTPDGLKPIDLYIIV